jgi:hypothetical protein
MRLGQAGAWPNEVAYAHAGGKVSILNRLPAGTMRVA